MAITKIIVSDMIVSGSLFSESGYDASKSADNLAELKGEIITGYLGDKYPDVEIFADIAIIEQEADGPRPLEVLVCSDDNKTNLAESAALQERLSQKIAEGMADCRWAVKTK